MGVYEEAQMRLMDIQSRINRVSQAGRALDQSPADKTAKTKFRMMYATVPKLLEEFEAQFTIIIKQRGRPDKDQKSEDSAVSPEIIREKFDEAYFTAQMIADEHIPSQQNTTTLEETLFSHGSNRQNVNFIPIEKLSLATFSGNIREYSGFRNLFDELVHNNSNYKPIVKFSYLKAKLEGEPLKLITNLMLSDSNYELALKILDNRYSDRRAIAQSHFDQLWNMPKAIFGDSKSIRQVINCITESVGALENQNYAVDQWDPILLYLFQKKLDVQLRAQWELTVDSNSDPRIDEFITFLTKFGNAASASNQPGVGREKNKPQHKTTTLLAEQTGQKPYGSTRHETSGSKKHFTCQVCHAKPGHLLISCPIFKGKLPKDRHQIIKDLKRCYLCFSEHSVAQCQNTKLCSTCGGRHHSMLHLGTTKEDTEQPETGEASVNTCFSTATHQLSSSFVLLATIAVLVKDANGGYQEARALLDSGSQSSFMTEYCRKRIGIMRHKCDVKLQAVAGTPVPSIKAKAKIVIRPINQKSPQLTIDTFILPKITGLTPSTHVRKTEWPHIKDLELADPRYNESLPIDILLGADVFPYITCGERREGKREEPVAFKTTFGWTLMGNTTTTSTPSTITLLTSVDAVDITLRRFWEIEELPNVVKTSPSEEQCEKIYHTTTTRQSDGRCVVHLPFIEYPPSLGESRHLALKRLMQLESRLSKSSQLRSDYNEAMYDYLNSGHMNRVETTDTNDNSSYYIPHHAVVKPESITTKVRVVYDASAISTNGKSLNDNLYPGAKLQQDLPGIIIRFRLHKVVFTADIKQMFRQIVVTPDHRLYQRLLFRFKPTEPVQTFEMSTVSFGQRSSPFLAIRTLHQLVNYESKLPGVQEKNEALLALLRWVQRVHFAEDWKLLNAGRTCSTKLRVLNTFIDPVGGLLRVGGRLRQSDLPFKNRHPILLPKTLQLTILLIDFVHRHHCHPGPQTTQNILQQEYWIISARSIIRKRLRQCVPCFKATPKPLQPSMGDLPKPRLVGTKPFSHVGIDFAGPFFVKAALLRRIQTTKGYMCIFVCMSTLAVHLELVSDLSTVLFLAALDRFVSRRGICTDLYSDCGTNFVGAKRYLKEVQDLIDSPTTAADLNKRQIQWHLNPPAAPHMGGLWEAAVKSAKTLLHRTTHDQIFTYEELNTIFHRVEATLNSRPLGAMSSDPNDPQTLTAGHFLTMGPLSTLPTPTNADTGPRLGIHRRWALVQRIQLHFWERWQKDYLYTLQVRSKWNKNERNLVIGDLVIIKEPTPPLTWKTARVVEVHPGEDDVVRVATVRDADGKLYKRPAAKLCLLPLDI